jgi:hypothetical protein
LKSKSVVPSTSLPFGLKATTLASSTSTVRPYAPAARTSAASFTPGISAFAHPAQYVPSAPSGRTSSFIPAPTGRYLPRATSYLQPARSYVPEKSIWHSLNPFN